VAMAGLALRRKRRLVFVDESGFNTSMRGAFAPGRRRGRGPMGRSRVTEARTRP
jgi:hypothetical protein